MKPRLYSLLLLLVLSSMLLSACGSPTTAASWPGVTLDQGTIYVAYGASVYAVKAADGSLIWSYPEKPDARKSYYANPLVMDGQVIVGNYADTLHAIDAATGSERWSFSAKGRWIAPAAAIDGVIYAPSANTTLYTFNAQGQPGWTFETDQALWGKPVSDGTSIYVTSMDHNLYAVTPEGKQLWKTDLGGAIVSSATLNAAGDMIFAGTLANELIAVETATGKIAWKFAPQGNIWSAPLVTDTLVIVGDLSGTSKASQGVVYAVDAVSGALVWKVEAGSGILASPVATPDGFVVATENGDVLNISNTGTIIWKTPIEAKLYSTPIVTEDRIILGQVEGESLLTALDMKGTVVWSFNPSKK